MIIDVATRVNAMPEQARLRNDFSGDAEPAKPKLISLDIWPDVVRGVPNSAWFKSSEHFCVS